MNILAIETSCDETSVAIVTDGTEVLTCITASSMDIHTATGGIIPENAARKQIEYILPTLEKALSVIQEKGDANTKVWMKECMEHIDAIAVTVGPGLIGSLLVGVETAKTLATFYQKPLIPVNHVKAHIYATFLTEPHPQFPLIALVVSGGHTDFIFMKDHNTYNWIGGTRDDAAGEAFDKSARLLGLGYPGGPAISKSADLYLQENPHAKLNLFPRPMIHDDTFDVSFSGLKTAVHRIVEKNKTDNMYSQEQLAAELQEAIIDSLINKTVKVVDRYNPKSVVICGGVSGNARLKMSLKALQLFEANNISVHVPLLKYTTDNAAMIGSFAFFNRANSQIETVAPNPELHFAE